MKAVARRPTPAAQPKAGCPRVGREYSLPESPRYLAKSRRPGEEALAVLTKLGHCPAERAFSRTNVASDTKSDPRRGVQGISVARYCRHDLLLGVLRHAIGSAPGAEHHEREGLQHQKSLQYTLADNFAVPLRQLFMMYALDKFGP